MPSPLVKALDLLTPIPITTMMEEAEYSEIAMATVARALHGLNTGDTLPPKKEFVSRFLLGMQPWLPTTREGRMSKRITAYMYKNHRLSIEPKLLETIGTYLGQDSPSGPWMFDITNRLDWQAGDYGDHDACFMKERRSVLDAMMEDGCTAIRFYEQLEQPLGSGRAWIAPSEHGPVVFNAYGPDLNLVRGRIAQLLPGTAIGKVKLTNQGSSHGQLYINQATALLVGGDSQVRSVNIEIPTGSDRPFTCANCGERSPMRYVIYAQDTDGNQIRVCRACHTNYWAQDYLTGQYHRRELLEQVECVFAGELTSGSYEYAGAVTQIWVFASSLTDHQRCDRCERLTNGSLYISIDGDVEHWCYLCAHDAPLECRDCSYYLPETEDTCQCGSHLLRRRGDRWA